VQARRPGVRVPGSLETILVSRMSCVEGIGYEVAEVNFREHLCLSLLLALVTTLALAAVAAGEESSHGCEAGQMSKLGPESQREGQGSSLEGCGTPDSTIHQPPVSGRFSVYRGQRPKPADLPAGGLGSSPRQARAGAAQAAGRPGSDGKAAGASIYSPMPTRSETPDEWWKHRMFLPVVGRSYYLEPPVVSDDFSDKPLNRSIWTLINPGRDATFAIVGPLTRDAWLCISVPGSSSHNIWDEGNRAARVMQSVRDTDFEIEVKFESGVSQKYQMQGILIEQDENHFVRLDFHSDGVGTKIFAATFVPGSAGALEPNVRLSEQIIDQVGVSPVYMRVRHRGERWTLFWSRDGADWSAAVSFHHDLNVTRAGAYAGNAGSGGLDPPAHTACLDYFFNTERPIVPEDPPLYTLAGNVVGHGLITMEPAQQKYNLEDLVTVTAMADPGWFFTGWSGDMSGIDNPVVITVDGDEAFTATFAQEEYTLSVNLEGEGAVAEEPDEPVYHYGDVVSLTATGDPGWSFAGWSGDLSGTDNPETITMDSDKDVTATFAQDKYTLTVGVEGEGTVSQDPQSETYFYGEVVTLTATTDTGWSFSGWSGDLSGTDSPETITMDGNKDVTATFTRDEYTLTVGVEGEGTVSQDPQSEAYFYGEVVTLTATADIGWSFEGWSGDLSGTDNPETITMDGNKDVTATFAQDQYTLTVIVVGEGSVDREPDQETYTYGEVVTLTATADIGWSFDGWSGDLSGTDNPETITMDGNKDVTATFTQDQYTLTVIVEGEGSVDWEPDEETYTYGDVVTLTAVPDLGSTFVGWSGDLSGSSNPDSITMVTSKSVTATFLQDGYALRSLGVDSPLDRWLSYTMWRMSCDSRRRNSKSSPGPVLT
jgi:uncharacterized repeat protein (TIGR02543 family)